MRSVAALLLVIASAAGARADLFGGLGKPLLRPVGRALAVSVAKSVPIPAASSGISFTFDPATSAFVRDLDIAGEMYLEQARPIGAGKLNLSVTQQWVPTDTIDGQDLRSLHDDRAIVDPAFGTPFRIPRLDVDLDSWVTTWSVTYGLGDDGELNLTAPLFVTTLRTSASLQQLGGGPSPNQTGSSDDTAVGFGDLLLRGKYRLLRGRLGEVAVGLGFRLPTGNQGNFQGTGLFEVDPRLFASTPAVAMTPSIRVRGHLNAGLDLTPQSGHRSEGNYGVGVDVLLATRASLSVAFLAREPFGRLLPPGSTDVERTDGTRTPIFGIDPGHPSYYDLSIGARVNLWRDTVFGVANVVVPLNDQGVRSDVIPLIGLEAAF